MHQKSKKIILIGLTLGAVNDYLRSRHLHGRCEADPTGSESSFRILKFRTVGNHHKRGASVTRKGTATPRDCLKYKRNRMI